MNKYTYNYMCNVTVYFSVRRMQQNVMIIGEKFYKQGRKCTWNVTLRRVHAAIVVMEKQCVTYSECVFVAIGFQHTMLVRQIVICGLSGCTLILHIVS
jgi:hypothetical protein